MSEDIKIIPLTILKCPGCDKALQIVTHSQGMSIAHSSPVCKFFIDTSDDDLATALEKATSDA